MSAVEDCCGTEGWLIEVRFLFPELEEEGEDMTSQRRLCFRERSEVKVPWEVNWGGATVAAPGSVLDFLP